ncbi:MAG: hypothetical protein ACLRFL_01540 [Clostridia bacterium]
MRIAVDFDKTLFDCDSRFYQLVNRFLPKSHTNTLTYTPLNCVERKDNLITKLYNKLFYFTNVDKYTEYNNALRSINLLESQGHEVIILCSRPLYQLSIISLKDLARLHNIDEKRIIINCNNKVEYCKLFHIDLIIDNDPDICLEAKYSGLNSICFTNNNYDGINTINSWNGILSYLSSADQQNQKI